MAASQAAHEGSIPFTRFSAAETAATKTSRLAAEEFLERLKEFVRDVASFFPEVVQFLRELHLFAAVDFAARRGNFVHGEIEFVGGAGGFTTGGREMI